MSMLGKVAPNRNIFRDAARKAGAKTFTDGKPCQYGHLGDRYTSTGGCVLCVRERSKINAEKGGEARKAKVREQHKANRKARLVTSRKWRKSHRSHLAIRWLLKDVLKRAKSSKTSTTHRLLGYDTKQFQRYIENLFDEGMSWNNHGEWHIDHIKPVDAFIKEGINDVKIINALANLRPLWAFANLSKGCSFKGVKR